MHQCNVILPFYRRDVPPCIAIQKKNLLLELDLVDTLQQVSKVDPTDSQNFWCCDYFKESLASGEFLALDYPYFANVLTGILSTDRCL